MAALQANSQSDAGHDVKLIFSYRPETPININKHFSNDVELINIQMKSPTEKVSSLLAIRAYLKKINPDIIIMHSSIAGFIGRISCIGILTNCKKFYIPHCISFMRKDIGKIKKTSFIILERLASLVKTTYLACSESEKKYIEKHIPTSNCLLLENAVTPIKNNSRNKRQIKTIKIITVGQIREQKGPKEFSEIASLTLKENPEIKFIWVGDGDKEKRKRLEKAGVHVTGWATKEEVEELLADASLYLSTAKWEGMPVSIIEAIYSKLPVIASDCAGNKDIVIPEKTGFLFSNHLNVPEMITRIIAETERLEEIKENAYKTALVRFSKTRYINELEKIISA